MNFHARAISLVDNLPFPVDGGRDYNELVAAIERALEEAYDAGMDEGRMT
jgi:hypothetical protein